MALVLNGTDQRALRSIPSAGFVSGFSSWIVTARFRTGSDVTSEQTVAGIGRSTSFHRGFFIRVNNGNIVAATETGTGDEAVLGTATADTEYVATMRLAGTSSIDGWLNSSGKQSLAVDTGSATLDEFVVGAHSYEGNISAPFGGEVAYCYVWQSLTDAQVDSIHAGTDPSTIGTVEYGYDLVADANIDAGVDSTALTLEGSPTFNSYDPLDSGASPGLRHTLKDTDTGNAQASLTGLQVMAFKNVPANPTYQATDGTTDGSGVYELNEPTINLDSITGESLGTTDGSGNLSATLAATSEGLYDSIEPSSISITIGSETITDDGAGTLTGDASATGTIDYSTGAVSISGAAVSTSASGDYDWRQTEIFLTLTDSAGENVAAAWMSVVDLNTSNESVIRTGA